MSLTPHITQLAPGVSLLRPLSRRGHGPGLIVLGSCTPPADGNEVDNGIPSHRMKWAEEGYTVVEILTQACTESKDVLAHALSALGNCETCVPSDKTGLVVYDPSVWPLIAPTLVNHPAIVGAVLYTSKAISNARAAIPMLQHVVGQSTEKAIREEDFMVYQYPKIESHLFATPFHEGFDYINEAVSHTRNLTFLKKYMGGPYFDLEAIWEEHTYYEFTTRSVPDTMATMVQEPYVNHIPTLTGGIGRARLTDFYQNHFVFQNPADTEEELISRTVGIDRVIDEFVHKFTHDMQIDWLLPGIPPTGKRLEIPFTAVVNIRGDRLYHEHIAWDQSTALRQLGLLPDYLPYPYALPDGRTPGPGKRFEYKVPAAGRDTAEKMRDKNSIESNQMFASEVREVDL